MLKQQKLSGFTLIEILVVVALIAILTAITFIAINPAKNFADTRNTQRSSDVVQILNAVTQYTSEQGHAITDFVGTAIATIPTCPTVAHIGTGSGNINLATQLVDTYIVGIPVDPSNGTAADTQYSICRTAGARITVSAVTPEVSKVISVKR